jgi:hypothetical protein
VRAARRPAISTGTVALAPQLDAQQAQALAMRAQVAPPEAFWPSAPRDIFDYVLSSKDAGLWANGYGVILVSAFAQPPARMTSGRDASALATGDKVEPTTGAGSTDNAEHICGEPTASRADAVTDELRRMLTLTDDQRGILTELRSALLKADEEITAACARGIPSSLPERLQAMQDRLWAMRVTTTSLRAALEKFYNALTDEQKRTLEAQQPPEGQSRSGAPANVPPGAMCYALAQRAPQLPADQIARAVRPNNKDQQVGLRTLSELSGQMGQLMMASCPRTKPATAMARLDATLDRLDAMFFATVNMTGALNDFYQSLSDAQKARLDSLSLTASQG